MKIEISYDYAAMKPDAGQPQRFAKERVGELQKWGFLLKKNEERV